MFYLLLYFVLTNYEAIPIIIRVNVPISPSAPQNPMSDPLTIEFVVAEGNSFKVEKKPKKWGHKVFL